MAETDRAEAALVPPGPRGICHLRDRRRGKDRFITTLQIGDRRETIP
jgi:hypothetical protein